MEPVLTQTGIATDSVVAILRVHRIAQASELPALRAAWNRLAGGVPTRRWDWLEAWWRHYGNGSQAGRKTRRTLYLLTVRDDDGVLVGLAPFYMHFGLFGLRTLRMLGDGEVCSDYLSVLSLAGAEVEVCTALANWLHGEGRGDWDAIVMDCIDAADVVLHRFYESLRERGCLVYRRAAGHCWRIALPERWESYVACLPRQKRKNIRQAERRYFDTGRVRWHTVNDMSEFHRAWSILIELHQRRRRSLGNAGMFASPSFRAFHHEVALRMLERGVLNLQWLEVDGRPVAAEYNFVCDGVIYAYQSGLEPRALAAGPGHLAMILLIQDAITKGYREFDYLRGDDPYKTCWNAKPRPLTEVRIVPMRITARWSHALWLGKEACRVWLEGKPVVRAAVRLMRRLAGRRADRSSNR